MFPNKRLNRITEAEAIIEAQKLRDQITRCDQRYYEGYEPLISDSEYDALRKRLLLIERKFPQLKAVGSVSDTVGFRVSRECRKVVLHNVPMLSLNNAFTTEEVISFLRRVKRGLCDVEDSLTFYADPKIDGVSLSVRYENGRLTCCDRV